MSGILIPMQMNSFLQSFSSDELIAQCCWQIYLADTMPSMGNGARLYLRQVSPERLLHVSNRVGCSHPVRCSG